MKQPVGVILAGGRSRRMGGQNKALLTLGGETLLSRATDRLAPQVAEIAVNTNIPLETELPCLPDARSGFAGPLAGVLTALEWAHTRGADYVVTVAVDTPFFPCDLVPRLLLAAETHPLGLAIAATPDGAQPIFGLWPVKLRNDLSNALISGTRKVTDWTDRHRAAVAQFQDSQAFANINTPEDLEKARASLA